MWNPFHRFAERIECSESMKKGLGGKIPRDLRDKIRLLYKLFRPSVVVKRPNSASQILKYRFREAEYRTSHGWIFVVEKKNILKTCYEVGKISEKGYKLELNQRA